MQARTLRIVGITKDEAWKGEGEESQVSERINIRDESGSMELQAILTGEEVGSMSVGQMVTVAVAPSSGGGVRS